ncbi:ROK family protein [uncultured Microbacterium sp.]|uniref:ROK family protein n=1 Tax=uncultured Microbacterium sp. TaxID=191216 RepID=UPI0025F0DE73|nr:ROK family protein [uncultured Microbacterium sp.]
MIDSRAIGIDVGGTSIKAVIADRREGRVLLERRTPTPSPDPDGRGVCATVARLADDLPGARGLPLGVVVPGIVDESRGRAILSANLGWRELELAAMLRENCGRPLALGHDVRAAALAEARWGAAADGDGVLAFVPIGTGIAAAVLVDGRPLVSDGWAGEIGQGLLADGPFAGRRVEEVASAAAIARRAGEPDAQRVAARVAAGDPVATRVWDGAVDVLATALAHLALVVAPRTVVIGGGLALAGDTLLHPLASRLRDRLGGIRVPDVRAAVLGDRAGALGAALIAEGSS